MIRRRGAGGERKRDVLVVKLGLGQIEKVANEGFGGWPRWDMRLALADILELEPEPGGEDDRNSSPQKPAIHRSEGIHEGQWEIEGVCLSMSCF